MKNILKYFALAAVVFTTACDKDPDIWQTNTKDINGTWEVTIVQDDETLVSHEDGCQVYIYNTNANDDNIWIETDDALLPYKVKANSVPANLSFQGNDVVELPDYGVTIKEVRNGIVVKKGVQVQPEFLLGGPVVADSIYFEVLYQDQEDGQDYILKYSGYRHTGWESYVE